MFKLWHHPIYTDGLSPEAHFPRERYRLAADVLQQNSEIVFETPSRIEPDDLLLAHDRDFRDAFLSGDLPEEKVRRIGLKPWSEEIVERTLILTNGTVSAARHVLEVGGSAKAGNLGGGTHHAYYDFGSGYCIFNDLAIAARVAQRDFGVETVLILDLDVHQGDGTAAIFANDPTVRTVSFHCRENFPFRKMKSDLDVEFSKGTGDAEYLSTLAAFLEREAALFRPDLILYQAGVDTLKTDRLGHLELTRDGLQTRNQLVFDFVESAQVPCVITMGGGYGVPIETSVDAFGDLFSQAAGG